MSSFNLPRISAATFVRHVEFLAETGSTNDVALDRIASGGFEAPALILAERQTGGRGRGANRWWSGGGGLTFSLILRPESIGLPLARWPRISLVAALAVSAMLEERLPAETAQLKWPNDVFCRGRKICGILVEAPAAAVGPRSLVVGIGVNVNNSWAAAPEELRAVGTALCDLSGQTHDPTEVLIGILVEFEALLAELADDDPRLPALWRERCYLTGRLVTVDVGGELVAGECLGIEPSGALALETPSGIRRLTGGIVKSYS